jgi:hypothetical protein
LLVLLVLLLLSHHHHLYNLQVQAQKCAAKVFVETLGGARKNMVVMARNSSLETIPLSDWLFDVTA